MMRSRRAARCRAAALFVLAGSLATAMAPQPTAAQSPGAGVVDGLVDQATQLVNARYTRPLGRVAERKRDRVFVLLRQLPPPAGTMLEAVRAASGSQPERVVARLEVLQTTTGVTECKVKERVGRAHAEPGDAVRRPVGSNRLLLAPCVSLVDLAAEIPQVLGEKLRATLLRSTVLGLVDDPQAERRAEAAYLSNAASEFVARQTNVDEVLFPVLLQAGGKMILNLEYYGVERGRATEIEVATEPLDDLMRAWLRAGHSGPGAPNGFRRLPPQTHPWTVVALGEGAPGDLVVVDPDSLHVLRFDYPGLRSRAHVALGPRLLRRRQTWVTWLSRRELQGVTPEIAVGSCLLSDERRPLAFAWPEGFEVAPTLEQAPTELEGGLESLWIGRKQDARWWPAPGQSPAVVQPCFADLDGDDRQDLVWSDKSGSLHVKLAGQRATRTFPGFGDVKAVQPARASGGRGVLWLTDPVWHGESDRLHQAQLAGDELQLVWSSDPFDGTIVAVACVDLNTDGLADVVAAEAVADGTRLHAYLAFGAAPGERGANWDSGARR